MAAFDADTVTLLNNVAATGSPLTAEGGQYIWSSVGTFGGTTLALQALQPDGTTYLTVASHTASSATQVAIGGATVMRVTVTGGSPSGLFSQLKRIPS